jgi:hypothetical protein
MKAGVVSQKINNKNLNFWEAQGFPCIFDVLVTLLPRNMFCMNSNFSLFSYFIGGLECVGHSFAYVAHFVFFEGCLNLKSECCPIKRARYQLTHPLFCDIKYRNFLGISRGILYKLKGTVA